MAKIKDWVDDFLERHRRRFNPFDWPEPGSEEGIDYARMWLDAFLRERVREQEADAASIRLGTNPPRFRNDHIPNVMAEVKAMREVAAATASAGVIADSLETAKRQSAQCGWCDGHGMRQVFHPRYKGSQVIMIDREDDRGEVRKRPTAARVAAHCICPLGRYMRAKTDDDNRPRIPDLQRVLEGRSLWMAHDPMNPEESQVAASYRDELDPRAAREQVAEWIEDVGAAKPF